MRKEDGLSIIEIILALTIIIGLIIAGYTALKKWVENKKIEDIKGNMLLIQGKCKILKEGKKVNKTEDSTLIGSKISDNRENEIVAEFLNKKILDEEKLEEYYFLTDEDLKSLGLDLKNEANSYYIVNYEENTVFITSGYNNDENIEYKLSE